MLLDQVTFAGLHAVIRHNTMSARKRGYQTVPDFGASYQVPRTVAG
jgi:hypothetical protein